MSDLPVVHRSFGSFERYIGKASTLLRKCLGYTINRLAKATHLSHNTIAKLERDETHAQPWVLGRILPFLMARVKDAFPEIDDIYDYLIPSDSFGDQLRNLRLRLGMQQRDMARALGIARYTIQRYERNKSTPNCKVRERINNFRAESKVALSCVTKQIS